MYIPDQLNPLKTSTKVLCRQASHYLKANYSRLPSEVQSFIDSYPYLSSLVFVFGIDSTSWIKHSTRGGYYFLIEMQNMSHRDKGFPINDLVSSALYYKEIGLLAALGFNYEVDFLIKNGIDMSEFQHMNITETISYEGKLNEKDFMPNIELINFDNLTTEYFFSKNDAEMMLDGYGYVPDLLSEKVRIIKEILNTFNICHDNVLVTKLDKLPGNILLTPFYPVIEKLEPEFQKDIEH